MIDPSDLTKGILSFVVDLVGGLVKTVVEWLLKLIWDVFAGSKSDKQDDPVATPQQK